MCADRPSLRGGSDVNSKPVVAMALGGLGGFNAHDAGVLAAAHECGLEPDIITCTSGAIFWTQLVLTRPGRIRAGVERQAGAVSGTNALQVAVLGDPGVFRPAYASWWARWFAPPSGPPLRDLLDRLFPAQLYRSTRPETFFAQIAADFSAARTPVMFNAYAVTSGRELVFCNQAAFGFLGLSPAHVRRRDGTFPFTSVGAESAAAGFFEAFAMESILTFPLKAIYGKVYRVAEEPQRCSCPASRGLP